MLYTQLLSRGIKFYSWSHQRAVRVQWHLMESKVPVIVPLVDIEIPSDRPELTLSP